MDMERRRYPRLNQPLDGVWGGASGSGRCRVADVGLGGCFVQAMSAPPKGEMTTVGLTFAGHTVSLTGRVTYVDQGIGFGVEFADIPKNEQEALRELLGALAGQKG
jgi:hypothetical protein